MTDECALLAAILASPDDYSLRLVWLDAFQERHGETPWVKATREFLAKCGERRKYETQLVWSKSHFDGSDICDETRRRALPGWREWLGGDETWQDMRSSHNLSWIKAGLLPGNWWKLCPSLTKLITREASWRRKSATVELWFRPNPQPPHYERVEYSARLTFACGFLGRVECRDWRSADALLPEILADQPFVECGIRGQPSHDAELSESVCGPSFQLIDGAKVWTGRDGVRLKYFAGGNGGDDYIRAHRALSNALRKRALATAPVLETAR